MLTNNPKYADAMERLIWNNVFAAQTIDGDCNKYDTPPNGYKPWKYFHGPDCCTASGHRLMSMLPDFVYTTSNSNTLTINQYMQTTAAINLNSNNKIRISQTSPYPQEDNIIIHVKTNTKSPFTINLRIPAWCKSAKIYVNGEQMPDPIPGTYTSLTRKWGKNDQIELQLPMELQWVRRENHKKVSDHKPYPAQDDPDPPYALVRGPIVYAVDNIWFEGDFIYRWE